MNIFEMANIHRSKNITLTRLETIKREGSPYYTWTVPATAAAAVSVIHVPTQFPASRKYEPLDWIEIANNEAANALTLIINGNTALPVPPKTIRQLDNHALWDVAVRNDGGAITTLANIIVTLQRQPLTMDRWVRRQP